MSRILVGFVRRPKRLAVVLVVVAAASAVAVWRLQPEASAESALPVVAASRDDVVVSVGGVGRIVPAGAPADGSAAGTGSGAASSVPTTGVYPRTSGHIARFLVAPGKRVVAGQAVALLDDGGSAASAVRLARVELASALLELKQRQARDPATGLPASSDELAAARAAVDSARARLARLLAPARRAAVGAARLEVRRAEAELETLLGTPVARAEGIRIAERNVELARQRLDRILGPASSADVAAAEAELKKAEADLALLRKPRTAAPEAIAAANAAVVAARDRLVQLQGHGADFVAISTARAEFLRAVAELAALQNPAQPLAEEIASAEQAVEAARAKLVRLLEPPNPAEVTSARLEVERAQAELRRLRAGPNPASIAAARQSADVARAKLRQLLGPPHPAEVTAGRLEVRRAEAELAVLRSRGRPGSPVDVELAELKVEAARARLAAARGALRLLTVRASSPGIVASLVAALGAPVDRTTPIAAVADLSRLDVAVQLSEFEAAPVKRGLKALVSVDALGGKSFPGQVLFAGLTGTDTGGVVTFPVRVGLTRNRGLRPGMNVSVRIIVAARRDVVQVPLEAVLHDDEDRPFVTVVGAAGRTAVRSVKLGLANNQIVEIRKGLRAGERVILPEPEEEAGAEGEEA